MRLWVSDTPTGARRRQVAVLFPPCPVPSLTHQMGRFLHGQAVRVAAMVVDIVHQGDEDFFTDRQQVSHGIAYIIIFQRQAISDGFRQISKNLTKAFHGKQFITINSPTMDIDHIGTH